MIELTVSKEQKLKQQMIGVIEESYSRVDINSIKRYLELWKGNKETLYNFLSKQNGWNEDELCLVVKDKVFRGINSIGARSIIDCILCDLFFGEPFLSDLRWLMRILINNKDTLELEPVAKQEIKMVNIFQDWKDRTTLAYGTIYYSCHLNTGMKLSRAILKIIDYYCNELHIDYKSKTYRLEEQCKIRSRDGGFVLTNNHTWEQAKAKLCDYLSPITVDETFYISINPLDYLTMSHGDGWSSCHSLRNKGCYHGATISTLADSSTVIIYTLPIKNPEKDFYKYNKKTRQMMFVAEKLDGLFQQVFYPSKNTNDNDVIRHILEALVAQYLEVPNLWNNVERKRVDIEDGYYKGYRDWEEGKPFNLVKLKDVKPRFKIGEKVPCVDDVSIELVEESYISAEDYIECECCGALVGEDSIYYLEGCQYCPHCVEEYFTRCSNCEDWTRIDDAIMIDGEYYCSSCARNIDYVKVQDGTYTTEFVIFNDGNEELYYSTADALLYDYPDAEYCDDCGTYYIDECAFCKKNSIISEKIEIIKSKIEGLNSDSEYFPYKEEFSRILCGELSKEIKELIFRGEFNEESK